MENLIPLINKLQDAFASAGVTGMDLPQIAVIGSQSSGKSSVLESIVGKDFLPRGSGIVTRRPLVLQLNHHSKVEEYGVFLHNPSKKIHDFQQIRTEIEMETERMTGKNKGISSKPINLKIYSPHVINLTLIDLPGITKVPVGDQPPDIEIQIRDMVSQFIEKESCLILAVSPANSDIANSDALQMARKYDPTGSRTIGVLTKLDLMDEGTDALDILTNKIFPLQHGFVGVVNRSQKDIESKKDVASALKKEQDWFKNHPIYSQITEQCGTEFLQEKLRKTLVHHISSHLPPLKARLNQRLSQLQGELAALNSPFKTLGGTDNDKHLDEPTYIQNALMNIIRMFGTTIKSIFDGHDGDISSDSFDVLGIMTGDSIGLADGDERKLAQLNSSVRIKFLFQEIFPKTLIQIENRLLSGCMDDEIRVIIHNTRGLRAGLFLPDAVFEILVKREIKRLEVPATQCVDEVHDELVRMINRILQGKLSPIRSFPQLQTWMFNETRTLIDLYKKPTIEEVHRLIEMEMGYINTGHPDFIGNNGITHFLLAEKEKRIRGQSPILPKFHRKFEIKSGHKEGHLTKLGGTRKNWKKRWFLLQNGSLSFYDNAGDKNAKGFFTLANCFVRDMETEEYYPFSVEAKFPVLPSENSEDAKGKQHVFEIFTHDGSFLFRNHRNLFLIADSAQEKGEWIEAVSSAIEWARLELQRNGNKDMNNPKKITSPPPQPPKPTNLSVISNISRPPTPNFDGSLPKLPENLYASDLKNNSSMNTGSISSTFAEKEDTTSNSDEVTISLVRMLLHSYFVIVRKHVQDLVPKAVMLMMITKIKKELPQVLSQKVLSSDSKFSPVELLRESESVRAERTQKTQMCKIVKEALNIIENDVRVTLSKN